MISLILPSISPIISLILTLVILGVCLWLIEKYLPIDETIKVLIRVIVVLAVIVFLLHTIGLY